MARRELAPWRWGGLARRGTEGERDPLEALHRQVDQLFEDFGRGRGWPSVWSEGWPFGETAPRVDEAEDEQAVHITAELPGLDEKDVEVTLSDGVLTVRGEKKEEQEDEQEGRSYYRRERTYGAFARSIPLPAAVDENKIAASFKNGVLKIDLPKTEEARKKARRIEIKGA